MANLVRVPKKQTALLSDFEVKRDRIARETIGKNVTNISGVPSWMMSVLSSVMELTGKTHLEEVWHLNHIVNSMSNSSHLQRCIIRKHITQAKDSLAYKTTLPIEP